MLGQSTPISYHTEANRCFFFTAGILWSICISFFSQRLGGSRFLVSHGRYAKGKCFWLRILSKEVCFFFPFLFFFFLQHCTVQWNISDVSCLAQKCIFSQLIRLEFKVLSWPICIRFWGKLWPMLESTVFFSELKKPHFFKSHVGACRTRTKQTPCKTHSRGFSVLFFFCFYILTSKSRF